MWPNGADFDPDMLYRWEEYVDTFAAQMKKGDYAVREYSRTFLINSDRPMRKR